MEIKEGPRRLWALIHGLPEDAAAFRRERPAWTAQDEWAAELLEAVGWLRHEMASVLLWLGGANPSLPEPQRIQHPDRPEPQKRATKITTDPDEIAAFWGLRRKEVNEGP